MDILFGFLFSLNDKDYIIIILAFLWAGIFSFLNNDVIYKIYFGLIIAFLLFQVFNLEIKIIDMRGEDALLSSYESFLSNNRHLILYFLFFSLPLFWFCFWMSRTLSFTVRRTFLSGLLLWFLFPFFILGILVFILKNGVFDFSFLSSLMDSLWDSYIVHLFEKHIYILALFSLIFLFYRVLFSLFFSIFSSLVQNISESLWEKFWIKKQQEEDDER